MIADISTRWNSSFYAWARLIKVKSYIQTLLPELINSSDSDAKKDGKQLDQIMLTNNEWDLLQDLILVLGPFEEATKYLGGEKYVTHSIMHPIINQIKKLLLPIPSSTSLTSTYTSSIPISSTLPLPNNDILLEIENADDVFVIIEEVERSEVEEINNKNNNQKQNKIDLNKPLETENMLKKVKENLYNAICYYWTFLPEDYLISTILDPRIKYMDIRSNEEEEILREKYEEYKENYLPTPITSRPPSPTLLETTFSTNIYKPTLFAIFEQDQPRVIDEVTEYLKEDKIPFSHNPFEWWMSKKSKYPILAKMARIYLATPATSTPSERLFSDAGNILTSKRSRMNSELFKRIMFLKRNESKVNNIYSN